MERDESIEKCTEPADRRSSGTEGSRLASIFKKVYLTQKTLSSNIKENDCSTNNDVSNSKLQTLKASPRPATIIEQETSKESLSAKTTKGDTGAESEVADEKPVPRLRNYRARILSAGHFEKALKQIREKKNYNEDADDNINGKDCTSEVEKVTPRSNSRTKRNASQSPEPIIREHSYMGQGQDTICLDQLSFLAQPTFTGYHFRHRLGQKLHRAFDCTQDKQRTRTRQSISSCDSSV